MNSSDTHANSASVSNSKAYWMYEDPDGVVWPTYGLYCQWCVKRSQNHRLTKYGCITQWLHAEGIAAPTEVIAHNNNRGWTGNDGATLQPVAPGSGTEPVRAAAAIPVAGLQDAGAGAPAGAAGGHTVGVAGALTSLLAERRAQHGDFTDHARCAVALKTVFDSEVRLRIRRGQSDLSQTQLEASHMILHKLARIVAGDPNHDDHWRDIAGYATIAADRIGRS